MTSLTYKNHSSKTAEKVHPTKTINSKEALITEKAKKDESSISVLFDDENFTDINPFFLKNGLVKIPESRNLSTFFKRFNLKFIFKKPENTGSKVKVILAGVVALGAMFQATPGTNFAEAKSPNRSVKKNNKKSIKKDIVKSASGTGRAKLGKTINRSVSRIRESLSHRGLSVGIDREGNIHSGRIIMPARGEFSSGFGPRWGRFHAGIDIAAAVGTPINAAMTGKVSFTGWHGGYGQVVEITHPNGLVTRYAHCSKINVKTGQDVSAGENIANMGMTGHVTGPHVHFEVLANGVQVNPKNYM